MACRMPAQLSLCLSPLIPCLRIVLHAMGLPLWCYLLCHTIQRAPDTNLASPRALQDVLQPSLNHQGSQPSLSSVLTGQLSASPVLTTKALNHLLLLSLVG